jgi:hypothetical protein
MREWFTDEVIGPHFQAKQFIFPELILAGPPRRRNLCCGTEARRAITDVSYMFPRPVPERRRRRR